MEAQLLVITTPDRGEKSPPIEQAANAGLAGALATHLFAGECLASCLPFISLTCLLVHSYSIVSVSLLSDPLQGQRS